MDQQASAFLTRQQIIEKFQICECGHRRSVHDEEQPYECYGLERGMTYRCECRGFQYRRVEPAPRDSGAAEGKK